MKKENAHEKAVHQLLEKTRRREREVTARFKKALDPNYWNKLNPHLSVGDEGASAVFEPPPIDSRLQGGLATRFAQEG